MSSQPQKVVVNLTDEEQAAVQALQQELNLDDPAEVVVPPRRRRVLALPPPDPSSDRFERAASWVDG